MNLPATLPEVMTLDEVAVYLRLSRETVAQQAALGRIPGRRVEQDWRFLKDAIDDWLRGPGPIETPEAGIVVPSPEGGAAAGARLETVTQQYGRLAHDPTLEQLRKEIYARRGRPEAEPDAPR